MSTTNLTVVPLVLLDTPSFVIPHELTMRLTTALLPLLSLPLLVFSAETETEYILTNECQRKTQRGDTINVHYKGTLASDGSEFDASYNRGQPLSFTVGKGQVIRGWDEGLLDMCIGDKRKLTIPPEQAYGNRAMGQIPPNSWLGKWRVGCRGTSAPRGERLQGNDC